jgi:hypothetical protein
MTVDILSSNISGMAETNEELLFINSLCARTQELRKRKFPAAEQMAILLGVPPARYAKYETRSPLPHYLIPRFAALVGESIEFVLTGRESAAKASKSLRTKA